MNKQEQEVISLGWIDLPVNYDKEEFSRIQKAAEKIKNDSDVLLVIGIGGSYLGARAAVEALQHSFFNALPKEKRQAPQIIFTGNNISSSYIHDVFDLLEGRISRLMLSQNREQQQSQRLLSVFSVNCLKKSMAKKKH